MTVNAAPVKIIAEAGVNHNGDIHTAYQLVDIAADAGADYIKFQTFSPRELATANAPKAEYQSADSDDNESQLEMLSKLQLSQAEFVDIKHYCASVNIGFLSTAFDIESLDFLQTLSLDYIKVPSGEITNLPFLRHISSVNAPIILSTGMSTVQEIEAALSVLQESMPARKDITLLHCTSAYPAPFSDINLRAMNTLRDLFGRPIGYSDHTSGIEVSLAAVALGATIIEKHVTLDRSMQGPDHKASLMPFELKSLVKSVRNIELALGSHHKGVTNSERNTLAAARRSIVASCEICSGDTFTEHNITVKRPGIGLSPMLWDHVIGSISSRNYAKHELIEL